MKAAQRIITKTSIGIRLIPISEIRRLIPVADEVIDLKLFSEDDKI